MHDFSWLTVGILAAVVVFIAGILLRAALASETPPGWLSFITRKKAQGQPTKWKEWKDDD
ncbi:MAG: hypothetical protein ABI190_06870 [Casimicrobiaceae bacterium]